jgi:transcriptional regulator with XRE-family HTH domain
MMVSERVEKWRRNQGLSYKRAGDVLGISAQSLHAGLRRGTFSRLTIAKLLHLIPDLSYGDFLLEHERRELRNLRRRPRAS